MTALSGVRSSWASQASSATSRSGAAAIARRRGYLGAGSRDRVERLHPDGGSDAQYSPRLDTAVEPQEPAGCPERQHMPLHGSDGRVSAISRRRRRAGMARSRAAAVARQGIEPQAAHPAELASSRAPVSASITKIGPAEERACAKHALNQETGGRAVGGRAHA